MLLQNSKIKTKNSKDNESLIDNDLKKKCINNNKHAFLINDKN